MTKLQSAATMLVLIGLAVPSLATAQVGVAEPNSEEALRNADAGYWRAFNTCDSKAMSSSLAGDLEFYHDKGGFSQTREVMVDTTMKNICGNPNVKIRREAIASTIRYDAIPGYGGVLSGDHRFYMTEKGMPERLTGTAKFVMIWHFDKGRWELTRGLSLDHQPVAYVPPPAGLALDAKALQRYAGRYHMAKTGDVFIAADGDKLTLAAGDLHLAFEPLALDHFLALERPLQLYFSGSSNGKATNLTVVESGSPVESGQRDR